MSRIRKIQMDCRHATFLIEKRQQTTLSLRERVELFIHLLGCGVCRIFQRQSRIINRGLQRLFQQSAQSKHTLDEPFKQAMQEKINERLPGK